MSQLADRIERLSPDQAVRVLANVAKTRVARGSAAELFPDVALADDLAAAVGTAPAAASGGDVAKAAVLLLAEDPNMTEALVGLIDNPPTEALALDPASLGVGVAALIVLQSYIHIERDKDGKWT